MVAAEEEELLVRPLVFRAVFAPIATRSRSKAAPQANEAPKGDPPPSGFHSSGGGGGKAKDKASKTGVNGKDKKIWEVP